MSSCELTEIPESIGNLSNLKFLNLDRNQFTRFPDALFNLPAETEILFRGTPFPNEEIQRVQAILTERQARNQPAPQTILPRLIIAIPVDQIMSAWEDFKAMASTV